MAFTAEQQEIIASHGNIKINAVAGSGKTTTLVEYARTRPPDSRILYLAFNKSVRLESARKFADRGLSNVQAETAHSLAYRHVVKGLGYSVAPIGYTINDMADILGLKAGAERHREFVIANHVSRFAAYYCNSEHTRLADLDYRKIISDANARGFVDKNYPEIEGYTREWLNKMDLRQTPCTHDFYLKKFHLLGDKLPYDYILFDEGQDASPAMLALFTRQQHATRVIVGDTHQQIYGWRFAVNSLEKTDFKEYVLSRSFRFGPEIAKLARTILDWKKHLGPHTPFPIEGCGSSATGGQEKAILARSNLGLLLNAIEYIAHHPNSGKLYFEGSIHSYTYAEDGSSLYDVLSLVNRRYDRIRNPLLAKMRSVDELQDYIEKTDDVGLSMMISIIKEYGNEIPKLIQGIKDRHVDNDQREDASMVFSTVHRCKGMEYDAIHLVDDFMTESRLVRQRDKAKSGKEQKKATLERLNEEINLLYVAVTRARQRVYLPCSLLPAGVETGTSVQLMLPQTNANSIEDTSSPFHIHTLADCSVSAPEPVKESGFARLFRRKPCPPSFC